MHRHIQAVAITVSLFVGVAPVSAQGLGDLAKKAEESRKAAKKVTKVYTNADAGNVQAATVTTPADKSPAAPSAAGAQTAQTPAADAGQDKSTQKNQAYWAEKLKTLQGQLERDMVFADAMQTRINILAADLVNNDQGQRPAIEQDRNRAMAELARLQKSIADDKKAIADFEEEARRAGVPAGWLR
jgi:uncharacterized membrane protein YccC